jgi:hypothetical protein
LLSPFSEATQRNEENSVHIERAAITSALRSRGLNARADWVERELPEQVDTDKNAGLLKMLGIDPTGMSSADVQPSATS